MAIWAAFSVVGMLEVLSLERLMCSFAAVGGTRDWLDTSYLQYSVGA